MKAFLARAAGVFTMLTLMVVVAMALTACCPVLDSAWFRAIFALTVGVLYAHFEDRILARVGSKLRPFRQWIARHTVCRRGCKGYRVVRERKLGGPRVMHFLGFIPLEVQDVEILVACQRCGKTKQATVGLFSAKNGERHGTD